MKRLRGKTKTLLPHPLDFIHLYFVLQLDFKMCFSSETTNPVIMQSWLC